MHPLVTTALLGTGQKKLPTISGETPLDSLLATLPEGEKEKSLLLQAGTRALYRQAGYRPDYLQTIPEPAEPETQPVCPPKKRVVLAKILSELPPHRKNQLLKEALQILRQANQILPAELLPKALDLRDEYHELRPLLAATCGKRGIWLSQFHPGWHWISDELVTQQNSLPVDSEIIWQTGSSNQRVALLTLLRRIDPEQAREKLKAIWPRERAENRQNLLQTFETGLSSADEAFLETCLDDRSSSVRTTAATLLTALPESALTQRMQERAKTLLTYNDTYQLNIHPTRTLTAADERDKLILRTTQNDQAFGLLPQIVSRIPPDFWLAHFNIDLPTLLQIAKESEWYHELLVAWVNAALTYKAETWYQPLWDACIENLSAEDAKNILPVSRYKQLAAHLPAEFLEATISRFPVGSNEWRLLLPLLHKPWSHQMALTFIQTFEQEFEKKSKDPLNSQNYQSMFHWDNQMEQAALAWPVDVGLDLIPDQFALPANNNYIAQQMLVYYRKFKRIFTIRRSLYND